MSSYKDFALLRIQHLFSLLKLWITYFTSLVFYHLLFKKYKNIYNLGIYILFKTWHILNVEFAGFCYR